MNFTQLQINGNLFVFLPIICYNWLSMKNMINMISEHFQNRKTFTTNELYEFFSLMEKDISRLTVNWRVYNLVKKGVIKRKGRGLFSLGTKTDFSWEIDASQGKIAMSIMDNFPLIRFCIWPVCVIAGFYHHIAKNDYLIVEAEKDAVDSVFFMLKSTEKNVFKEPPNEIIENYLPEVSGAIVVKTLPSEAPLGKIGNIPVPSLEKIMVDLSADKLFSFLQGNELVNVLRNAFDKYTINTGRLMRYAKRRNRDIYFQDIITGIEKI